jgi:galactokinase/galacturonokinase
VKAPALDRSGPEPRRAPGEQIGRLRRALAEDCGADEARVRVVVSPYRICPLGAHVDHQHGPVLALAISAYSLLAFAPREDADCRLRSGNFPGEARFAIDRPGPAARGGTAWQRYARGAAWVLAGRLPDRPRGIAARVEGTLPGGGLSSSASVLLAYLTAFATANAIDLEPAELVCLARRAENEFVGVASGVLDPAAIVGARRGGLLAIDTGRVTWRSVPLGAGAPAHRILVAFTGTTRNLARTGFNQRVDECRQAARRLGELAGVPGARLLGDLPESAFAEHAGALPPDLRGRALHFAGERARVLEGIECWRQGDLVGFGRLMRESCRSSIENYQTGSRELVRLQEILTSIPGVLGARFSGAGYGGCGVALVEADAAERCRSDAERAFAAAFPERAARARFTLVDAEDGVRIA